MLSKLEIAKRIKEARKHKGDLCNKSYLQKELAKDLGISQAYMSGFESGRTYPSFEIIQQIAYICGVSLNFFTNTDSIENSDSNKLGKHPIKENNSKSKTIMLLEIFERLSEDSKNEIIHYARYLDEKI